MKIICIGRNYVEHAQELQNAVPEEPVVFLKPDTALMKNGEKFWIPPFSNDIHYECELVLRIGRQGKFIQPKFAHTYIDSVSLGIDFTARDLQNDLKKKGLPWEKAKAFNNSALCSDIFIPFENFRDIQDVHFTLKVNGEVRQIGHTKNMIFPIVSIIEHVSQYFVIKTGDLIYTGTPAGVGKVSPGDKLEGFLEHQKMFEVIIAG